MPALVTPGLDGRLFLKVEFVKLVGLLILNGGLLAASLTWADLWRTRDQQAARLYQNEEYREAAKRFEDGTWRGTALFRDGEFERAAAEFGRFDTSEAAYNRGNALVMLGKYAEAIASYDRALELKPGWPDAENNRRIAELRAERLERPEDDAGGTGGMLAPDEIVIDPDAPPSSSDGDDQVELGVGEQMSDDELRALWLRRIQTSPSDFLRTKFAYQFSRREAEGDAE